MKILNGVILFGVIVIISVANTIITVKAQENSPCWLLLEPNNYSDTLECLGYIPGTLGYKSMNFYITIKE